MVSVYLNHASVASNPRWEAVHAEVRKGLRANTYAVPLSEEKESARRAIARHLGVDARKISLARHTTEAARLIRNLIPFNGRLRIAFMQGVEYPSISRQYLLQKPEDFDSLDTTRAEIASEPESQPAELVRSIYKAQRRFYRKEVKVIGVSNSQSDEKLIKNFEKKANSTDLLIISHVDRVTGRVYPVNEIIRRVKAVNPGIIVVVDGAQSIGNLPPETTNPEKLGADFLISCTHKHLGGTPALGFLYSRKPITANDGDAEDLSAETQPAIHVVGNMLPIPEEEQARIAAKKTELRNAAIRGLSEFKGVRLVTEANNHYSPGIVGFKVNKWRASAFAEKLKEKGIEVKGLDESGVVRVSIGHENTREHIDRLLQGVREILQSKTSYADRQDSSLKKKVGMAFAGLGVLSSLVGISSHMMKVERENKVRTEATMGIRRELERNGITHTDFWTAVKAELNNKTSGLEKEYRLSDDEIKLMEDLCKKHGINAFSFNDFSEIFKVSTVHSGKGSWEYQREQFQKALEVRNSMRVDSWEMSDQIRLQDALNEMTTNRGKYDELIRKLGEFGLLGKKPISYEAGTYN